MLPSLPEETFVLVIKDLPLPELNAGFSEERALEALTKAISQLMDRDLERLLQICYRIDLAENTLKQILHEAPPERVAADLAQALWARQKQKVILRRKYSES
jgi:hypothetical protein